MLSYQECGSVRNYVAYLVAKSIDGFLHGIAWALLLLPLLIGLSAEGALWCVKVAFCGVHAVRRKLSAFVVAGMSACVKPVD